MLAIWRFWRAILTPARRTWIVSGCSTVAPLYLHHYFWLVVILHSAFFAIRWITTRIGPERWYVGGVVAVALYAPYLPILVVRQFQAAQGMGYIGRSLPACIQTLGTNLFNLGTGYRLNEFDTVILRAAAWQLEPRLLELVLVATVPFALAGIGLLSVIHEDSDLGLFITLLFGWTLFISSYTIFLSRHLAVVAGLYFVAITAGLLSLPGRLRVTALGLILLTNVLSLSQFYSTIAGMGQWRKDERYRVTFRPVVIALVEVIAIGGTVFAGLVAGVTAWMPHSETGSGLRAVFTLAGSGVHGRADPRQLLGGPFWFCEYARASPCLGRCIVLVLCRSLHGFVQSLVSTAGNDVRHGANVLSLLTSR